ncbi:MAG: hypothetical protein ACRCWI_03360 [Brevinema sp.]
MKLYLLLASCLFFSLHKINSFVVDKNNTFLDKVHLQQFGYQNTRLLFMANGNITFITQDKLSKSPTTTEFHLRSIYTPSKAVYTCNSNYIGIVIIDSSLYTTQMETNILDLDFNKLNLKGIREKHIF